MFVVEYIMSLRLDFAAMFNQSTEEKFCNGVNPVEKNWHRLL